MIDIGSNLDRVTCWQDRQGPPDRGDNKEKRLGTMSAVDGSSSISQGGNNRGSNEGEAEGCEFLRKETEREDCRRKRAAKTASMVLLAGE